MISPASIRNMVENLLYRRGFSSAVIRSLLSTQILISAFSLILGLLFCWLSLWPLAFGAGASIAAFSLWHIARFAQANIQRQYSPALAIQLFFGMNARLALVAIVLFALIVWLRFPLMPLLMGLGSTVAGIVVWGMSRLSRKTVKEA